MSLKLHSPVPATLKIHSAALTRVTQTLGPLWMIEGDCVTAHHEAYRAKLQKLTADAREVAACCQECLAADTEWAQFEQARPTPEERVRLAEIADLAYQFTPGEDEHPVAVGGCDLAIHAGNWTPGDERRGA